MSHDERDIKDDMTGTRWRFTGITQNSEPTVIEIISRHEVQGGVRYYFPEDRNRTELVMTLRELNEKYERVPVEPTPQKRKSRN